MGQTTLKAINCQKCGFYFKKNYFLHVKLHRFSWLCRVCGIKALNLESTLDFTSN